MEAAQLRHWSDWSLPSSFKWWHQQSDGTQRLKIVSKVPEATLLQIPWFNVATAASSMMQRDEIVQPQIAWQATESVHGEHYGMTWKKSGLV